MKQKTKLHKRLFLGIAAIAGITWLLLMLLLCEIRGAGIVGLCCGILEWLLACGLLLLPSLKGAEGEASLAAIPLAGSAALLCVSGAVNTVLIVWSSVTGGGSAGAVILALAANILIISGFLMFAWSSHSYFGDLTEKKTAAKSSTQNTALLSSLLGALLASSEDAEARAAVLRLKEAVDHSSNVTDDCTAALEGDILSRLQQLVELQDDKKTAEEAGKLLRLWRSRNAMKH